MFMMVFSFFFFFQAEDGIRDLTVTGVQTCALPISCRARGGDPTSAVHEVRELGAVLFAPVLSRANATSQRPGTLRDPHGRARSEERRVGKECRSRWSPYH